MNKFRISCFVFRVSGFASVKQEEVSRDKGFGFRVSLLLAMST